MYIWMLHLCYVVVEKGFSSLWQNDYSSTEAKTDLISVYEKLISAFYNEILNYNLFYLFNDWHL